MIKNEKGNGIELIAQAFRSTFHRLFIIFLLACLLPSFVHSQTNAEQELYLRQRTIFIFNFIRFTSWDDLNELRSFKIGVIGDDPISAEMAEMAESRTIIGLPIIVQNYKVVDEIKDAQLLYVNHKYGYDISDILLQIKGKNTLLISEDYGFNESMVNIISKDNIFQFEINEDLLAAENFTLSPALRKLAITSAERWREMYEDSEKNLESDRVKMNEQLEIIRAHENAIEKQNVQLKEQKTAIDLQIALLGSQKNDLEQQKNVLTDLQNQYEFKIKMYDSLGNYITNQKSNIQDQESSILKQDSILKMQDTNIADHLKIIGEQELTLKQQESKIELQQQFNYLLIALIALGLLATILIYNSYRNKKQTNKQLLQLNKEKNALIGVVSHDLRSPINQIKGLANIMLLDGGDRLENRQAEYINSIILSCERQIDMIKRILDINAIESKKINLNLETDNLYEIANTVVSNFKLLANSKSIELRLQNNSNTSDATVDKNYLIQVLENIISNAIKYSEPNNKVDVLITDNEKMIVIAVKDDGPGISKEDQEKMFGQYQKLTAKPTGGEDSYGLGLSIAKKYIEEMNGTINCKSDLGMGTTFELHFNKIAEK